MSKVQIEVIPPKFDLYGFYTARIKQMVHAVNLSEKEKIATLRGLVNQAYQQGRYDARILTKDRSKYINN